MPRAVSIRRVLPGEPTLSATTAAGRERGLPSPRQGTRISLSTYEHRAVVALASSKNDLQWHAIAVDRGMALSAQPAAWPADRMAFRFLFFLWLDPAPVGGSERVVLVPCWRAQLILGSTETVQSMPPAASACAIR